MFLHEGESGAGEDAASEVAADGWVSRPMTIDPGAGRDIGRGGSVAKHLPCPTSNSGST